MMDEAEIFLDNMKMVPLCNYSFTITQRIRMFCQNQYDYGDVNTLRLKQCE